MDILDVLGRTKGLFEHDLFVYNDELDEIVKNNRFLVIGGGGSIGQAVTKQLFKRAPKLLHVVDLSENYLVELVRDLRSDLGYVTKNFDTFAIDCGAAEFQYFMQRQQYDYVLNLSAMKHVRSEHDAFSMYRMLKVNMFNAIDVHFFAQTNGSRKYFCVSTDKAANPANFMGATKRAMERALMRGGLDLEVSAARFANVAFSNGSLLQGFEQRITKKQPLSAPSDVTRFFVTSEESGIICLFSALLAKKNEILFPYNENEIVMKNFVQIGNNYLAKMGKEGVICYSEEEARSMMKTLDLDKFWPINVFKTDTVGEKPFEEFYTKQETILHDKFEDLASVVFHSDAQEDDITLLRKKVEDVDLRTVDAKQKLLDLMKDFVPTFEHIGSTKTLNNRM